MGGPILALIGLMLGVFVYIFPDPYPVLSPKAIPTELTNETKLEGAWAPNDVLSHAQVLGKGKIKGLETLWFDKEGQMYGGDAEGFIHYFEPPNFELPKIWAFTGGRPFAGVVTDSGDMVVVDGLLGLIRIDGKTRSVSILCNHAAGRRIMFADDITVTRDGVFYFSDASRHPVIWQDNHWDGMPPSYSEFFEGGFSGRVLKYDPHHNTCTEVLTGVWFANGVALSREEDFLVVGETFARRLLRIWLKGPRAGEHEVFANLASHVDGVSLSEDGKSFWVAIPTVPIGPATRLVYVSRAAGFVRQLVARLPKRMKPELAQYGLVARVDAKTGEVVETYHDPSGQKCPFVTAVTEKNSAIYLGSLVNSGVCVFRL